MHRYLRLLTTLSLLNGFSPVLADSLWFKTGLSHVERRAEPSTLHVGIGFQGDIELTDTLGLYTAIAYQTEPVADAGAWFSFRPGPQDPYGWRSYLGAGLSYLAPDRFGLALSAAISRTIGPNLDLGLVYTHRPMFYPGFEQVFDLSLALRLELNNPD